VAGAGRLRRWNPLAGWGAGRLASTASPDMAARLMARKWVVLAVARSGVNDASMVSDPRNLLELCRTLWVRLSRRWFDM
jgi:hypothetical protein